MTGAAPVSHAMADFCLDASWQGLPEQVRVEAIRALVNWMACAVGGARTALAEAAARGVVAMEPQEQLDAVAERLNTRPRKTLGYRTPADKLAETVAPTS